MFGLFSKEKPVENPLFLYNTLSRTKEEFIPIDTHTVTMYTCGPTVYDNATIGNLRSYIFADTLKRTLIYSGYAVTHTMNLTDFGHLTDDGDDGEDKMMRALKRAEMDITLENMATIAKKFAELFKRDMKDVNNMTPTQYTPASKYVDEQIALITTLVEKGYAYETNDGVYFDISKFDHYGELGNIDLEQLREGARVTVNTEKLHPADFALWKKSELGWSSDWGTGFPGWHTECTAMIFATLGEQIDIHTGGEDLAYTHHNGEIAQAEAATNKRPYVRYWLHNAFLTVDNKRLGKSEGNAITLAELKDKGYAPLAYRYWLLTAHYRSPINFTYDALNGAAQALRRLQEFVLEHHSKRGVVNESYVQQFNAAMYDDINTPRAIAVLWEVVKDDTIAYGDRVETLRDFDQVLGLGLFENIDFLRSALGQINKNDIPSEVTILLEKRAEARKHKDFTTSDELRKKLSSLGYEVTDEKEGQKLRKASS